MSASSFNPAPRKTYEHIVKILIDADCKRVFTLPGLGITWSLPGFYEHRNELDVILTRSEQVASVMAQVTGKLTGKPGVLMGQGPWISTTGSFGILEAYFAGSPMVVLTETSDYNGFGQFGVYQTMTGDYGAADIQSSLKAITKYCTYATEAEAAVYGLQLALKHAATPRMGPAAVIMKTTIIREEITDNPRVPLYPSAGYWCYTPPKPDPAALENLSRLLSAAEFPVFVAGQGVYNAKAGAALQELAQNLGCAVTTSYNGKGVIDELSPIATGMLGTWGNRTANRTLARADLIIILGASMAPDYTRFHDPKMIRPGQQKIVQIDIDPHNAGWSFPVDLTITADVKDVIDYLKSKPVADDQRQQRLQKIKDIKEKTGYNDPPILPAAAGSLHHTEVVAALQKFLEPRDILCLDAGSNRIWATNSLRVRTPNQLLVPGGIGGMGWGGPAAAAAKLVRPEKRVTCLAGDGGFMMTMDVVATCAQYDIPVVFVVANNSGLGMVRDNMGAKKIAVDFGSIDFAKTAEGLGAIGMGVDSRSGLEDALAEAHQQQAPVVIDIKVDPEASFKQAADTESIE